MTSRSPVLCAPKGMKLLADTIRQPAANPLVGILGLLVGLVVDVSWNACAAVHHLRRDAAAGVDPENDALWHGFLLGRTACRASGSEGRTSLPGPGSTPDTTHDMSFSATTMPGKVEGPCSSREQGPSLGVRAEGIEPSTYGLRVHCSAN